MLRQIGFALLLITLGATGTSGPVSAQCEIEVEIQRAFNLIEKAGGIVERSGIPEAQELLQSARVRTREAVERARRGEREFACKLASVAQSLAIKAAEVAERGLRSLDELEGMLRKTDELLREAASRIEESRSVEGKRMFTVARDQQKEAWSSFRSRRARLSVKLTRMARETAQRALRMAEGGDSDKSGNVERQLRQTNRLLNEAFRRLEEGGSSENATQALAGAQRLQDQAKRQFRIGHPQLALGLTRQARVLIRRALNQSDVQPARQDIHTMIQTTSALIKELREAAAESENDRARQLLGQARRLLDDARKSLKDDNLRHALRSARTASALALDVSDLLERGGEEEE